MSLINVSFSGALNMTKTGNNHWKNVSEEDRIRLLHGPYKPPLVRVGRTLQCQIRGNLVVAKFSDGRIPWPMARNAMNLGKGSAMYILCGDLARAIRSESVIAICYWWGVGSVTVAIWRRLLGVQKFNEGTLHLWSCWRKPKLPRPCAGTLVEFDPSALRSRRLASGLTLQQVADQCGWGSPNTYGQLELGRRRRATTITLGKIATAFKCTIHDLKAGAG
jgi:Helix-turn-helix domain